jgi:putative ABC transport system permease protein
MGVAAMVLLIACANLANMTLARAAVRGREFAIRIAVGAGRWRVLCQLLLESTFLAAIGGAMGVVLAHLALDGFVSTWPDLLPRLREVGISRPVLGFTIALSLGSGVFFGLAPAVLAAESGFGATLREGTRSVFGGSRGRWMRRGLVVSEVALAMTLLIGSGLLVRSFATLRGESPGFLTDDRLVFTTRLPRERYGSPDEIRVFTQEATARLQSIPGVESVAITNLVPISGADEVYPITFEGRSEEGGSGVSAILYRVSDGYLRTMGIALVAGRPIDPGDLSGNNPVAVVTRSFAERNYEGESPIGHRIRFGGNPVWAEIVGVVGDVQHYRLGEESLAQIYLPFQQEPTRRVSFVIEASLPPLGLVAGIREAIGQVDPNQPLTDIRLADDLISESVSLSRFRTLLMTGFGLTALLLAVVGLYGVVAYGVSTRRKEMGVRIALGAEGGSILGMVLRESLSMVGLGLAIGLGLALALTRVLQTFLFRVSQTDPLVFSLVPVLLLAVATLAVIVPARRAASVDPVRTLGEG